MARTAGKGGSSKYTSAGDRKRELMKKLSLFHASLQVSTHDELEPILRSLGFLPGELLPPPPPFKAIEWQTYVYDNSSSRTETEVRGGERPPIVVKLPYYNFSGLHRCAYKAFLESIQLYDRRGVFNIRRTDVSVDELDDETRWEIDESDQNDRYMYKSFTLDTETLNMISEDADDENPSDESVGSSTTL